MGIMGWTMAELREKSSFKMEQVNVVWRECVAERLTHGVHRQRSPPRVGAVVLVVLAGRLGGRCRAGTPQTHLATRLVERPPRKDRNRQKKNREREIVNHVTLWLKDRGRMHHYFMNEFEQSKETYFCNIYIHRSTNVEADIL